MSAKAPKLISPRPESPNTSAGWEDEAWIIRAMLITESSNTYVLIFFGKVPYFLGCPPEPSDPVMTKGELMNVAMSSSFMLKDATPAPPSRTMRIAASIASRLHSSAISSSVLPLSSTLRPPVMSNDPAPPRRRRLSVMSVTIRPRVSLSSRRARSVSFPPA